MTAQQLLRNRLQQQVNPQTVLSFRLPVSDQETAQAIPASVLVPLCKKTDGWQILLTKRSDQLEHHPGQIGFVGGKSQPEDDSATETALREAQEEIGLLPSQVSIAGSLHRHLIARRFLVTPYVGIIASFIPQPNINEVDEIFFLPLCFLLDDKNCYPDQRSANYQGHQLYFGQHRIWGGTASILLDLKRIIKNNVEIYHHFTQS